MPEASWLTFSPLIWIPEYTAFDNLPIKGYVYPWEQIMKIHDLSDWQSAIGGKAAVCPDDGFMVLSAVD